jgi:hypothetical protein
MTFLLMLTTKTHYQYYFVAAAVAIAIAGIVHLLIPLYFVPTMLQHFEKYYGATIFFLGSGIVQIFWILPTIKRWGRPWYYIGIAGNIAFIILFIITVRYIHGAIDLTCELAQAAYIIITAIILVKERTIKVSQRDQLR